VKIGACAWEFIEYATRPRRYESGRPVAAIEGLPDQFFEPPDQPQLDPADPLGWLIRNCHEYGLEALEVAWLEGIAGDRKEIERIRTLLDEHGVTLATNYHDDISKPERDLEHFELHLQAAGELGIDVLGIGGMPFTVNRFVDDPPLSRQLEMIVEHLKPWVAAAHQAGITLAYENHADYRCTELIEHVIDVIDGPNLGIKLDTGNCLLVIEDPVEAARAVGPLCYATHWKDMYVHPITPQGGLITGAPVGGGHCQLDVVTQVLAETAPNPDDLVLSIEINWMPDNDDYFRWLRASARACAEHLQAARAGSKEER
jgi:sugar phosphate isomerase/epimerase